MSLFLLSYYCAKESAGSNLLTLGFLGLTKAENVKNGTYVEYSAPGKLEDSQIKYPSRPNTNRQ